jgi:hypothetical protein
LVLRTESWGSARAFGSARRMSATEMGRQETYRPEEPASAPVALRLL